MSEDMPPDQSIPPQGPDETPEQYKARLAELRRAAVIEAESTLRELQRTRQSELRVNMMRSVVTEPLLSRVQSGTETQFDVIIALNELFIGGIEDALRYVKQRADEWKVKYATVSHYVFACLTRDQIIALVDESKKLIAENGPNGSVVYRIWEDTEINVSLTRSIVTVKADAAQRAFRALGDGIVWAVLDSGIDRQHPHFQGVDKACSVGQFNTFDVGKPLAHLDFTPIGDDAKSTALEDQFGHGSHVSGIIAGYWESKEPDGEEVAGTEVRSEVNDTAVPQRSKIKSISGIAPLCKLISLKVIADRNGGDNARQTMGQGKVSWVLRAIDQIQQWNQFGKRLLIHGVNMSLGYDFDPRWFGCGQSPICVEVNRLVKCGVVVVVSAGNGGYASYINAMGKAEARFNDLSITDPGNADLAITVGSTHREMPHLYGVSYFSSRGPTGDGRMKPDLVAPGERIVSCAAGVEAKRYDAPGKPAVLYCEQSGTSMAAPHVSGAIAAFLSTRGEFIGLPERVKDLFLANTVDLRREPKFQGAGLVDLMKVLQAV